MMWPFGATLRLSIRLSINPSTHISTLPSVRFGEAKCQPSVPVPHEEGEGVNLTTTPYHMPVIEGFPQRSPRRSTYS